MDGRFEDILAILSRQEKPVMNCIRMSMTAVTVACVLAVVAPAFAHHSFGAEYDGTKPVTLTGVITSVQWTNPHVYFFMDVTGKDGVVANWKFEGYPPVVL